MKRVPVIIPIEHDEFLRRIAYAENTSKSDLMRIAIAEYLEKRDMLDYPSPEEIKEIKKRLKERESNE